MRKIILIIGEPLTGKTFTTETMAKAFQNPFRVYGRVKYQSPFYLDGLTPENDLLIIDDFFTKINCIDQIVFDLFESTLIDRQFQTPIILTIPNIIINGDFSIDYLKKLAQSQSFARRVKVIKTSILEHNNGLKMIHSYTVNL